MGFPRTACNAGPCQPRGSETHHHFTYPLHLLGLKLNLYNLLSIPLCIGYGIDDHVFLVHRYENMPPHLRDPALVLSTTGRAIVLTTLSTMVGFAGLLVAHFEGLRLLGLSGALAVLPCLLATFAVLPALLALLWPQTPAPAGDLPDDLADDLAVHDAGR